MAQAVRPRPRPRLVSKQRAVAGETRAANTVDDEDELFRRNRGRTARDWKQLEQSASKATPFVVSDDDWDIDDPNDTSSKPRKKKRPIKQNERPRWQATDVARMLSSDNEDDDIQIIELVKNPAEDTSPNKRKRERSRSESITPPPELTAHQRANARILVRQALAYQPRQLSPALATDDSADGIDLDPELAKIAEAARQQMKHAYLNPERAGGPETIIINVRWRPHPRNPLAEEQCWTFKVGRYDTFRELFDGVADLAGVMADQLVIKHEQRRVFASGTPHSLHIWAEGEMEACDKHTAEYMRARQYNRLSSPSCRDGTPGRTPPTSPESGVEESDDESPGDTIKIVLRSAATKDKTFPLTVRSTTTCDAIVKAFLKASGLPNHHSRVASRGGTANASPRLMVDGDKMNPEAEIGDADLEDGDLIEVVGI